MLWLIVAISAYLILAIVQLVDKYLLAGPIPSPKVYSFYVGALGILILILAPFVNFYVPEIKQIILSLVAGAIFIYALFWFYKALQKYEASRVVSAVGGILPIFTFGLVYVFSGGKEILKPWEFLSLILLILGGVLITYEKSKKISLKSFQISAIAAFFLALSFVLSKYVYMVLPFWSGYIWIKIGGFLMAIGFLLTREVRSKLFKVKIARVVGGWRPKKTAGIFLSNQAAGAGANILQNWAIALAPLICVPLINALQGVQYVALLIFVTLLSLTRPFWAKKVGLKEEISKEVIFQKLFAILLIGTGLALLVLK
ncbi:MAG: hypothetical protein CO031_01290 [Candidatus Nealsonbacteria bacterium CG_4_9_14_0_2_um_filter_37_38]|uniref:EamA domain-containing protein n=1 Tax=Candidatus Nealsonbacteria bacterium CG_4_10_14_0_8_um_filter_37_14 TaxID=1974684 RepID=A0A2M7R6M9_9BACT|nr:MAG: hypothetical protein COV63_01145 [Candidatus Nealsonbacteria bacterium CG11_big_fil_rev_8_21_14_0_20_37_68]PIW92383.1 MAG: hypothetical protein COZ89_00165 [Candidatus Nealsonbacteria bacterium CG_4_8_14_3_um_filter_37_23]PIY89270.1 MAG: hypothetical protein COY73_01455 [Candidatus Nealsonbacteria bacterium CG_4_10_14_0_8_um_filter_37_14]PJC51669.1 MAG: hypothetical protein CO031_01290 [Candidatus Nealsonbacteria bacterium CG_4_9_14_0_2_um_filter_37_38]